MTQQKTKGYIIVGSGHKNFYSMAINCGESILDFCPEAKITIVTEERFLDGREKQFDNVILCDGHYRAKLWGMSQSPYDLTAYLDADMEIIHEDISNIFDEIEDSNCDMMFTPIKDSEAKYFVGTTWGQVTFKLNGGICVYDNTKQIVKDFVKEWDRRYKSQRADSKQEMFNTTEEKWWPLNDHGEYDYVNYPEELKHWDQFTLWWLINKEEKFKDIKIGEFEDYLRWNYYSTYNKDTTKPEDDIVIMHYSNAFDKWGDNL